MGQARGRDVVGIEPAVDGTAPFAVVPGQVVGPVAPQQQEQVLPPLPVVRHGDASPRGVGGQPFDQVWRDVRRVAGAGEDPRRSHGVETARKPSQGPFSRCFVGHGTAGDGRRHGRPRSGGRVGLLASPEAGVEFWVGAGAEQYRADLSRDALDDVSDQRPAAPVDQWLHHAAEASTGAAAEDDGRDLPAFHAGRTTAPRVVPPLRPLPGRALMRGCVPAACRC